METSSTRTRWAAVGAAVAVSLGAGGVGIGSATISSGDRAVFVPLDSPCRLASTRPAPDTVGPRPVGIGTDETYTLDGWGTEGDCELPTGTAALALNVTAVNASAQTNLRFFPAGAVVPDTANLNPTPGAPPTPNAVDVRLGDAGEFSVFNKFGVVEVVIDVIGYYADHDHDDRYATKAEIDALVDPDDIDIAPAEMRPMSASTEWSLTSFWAHASSGSLECLVLPIETVPGRTIDGFRVTYANTSGGPATLRLEVSGVSSEPGPPGGHFPVSDDTTVSVSASDNDEYTAAPVSDNVLRSGFHYLGTICTDDVMAVMGARILFGEP